MNAGFDAGTLIGTTPRGEHVRIVKDVVQSPHPGKWRVRYRVFVAGREVHTTPLHSSALIVAHKRIAGPNG